MKEHPELYARFDDMINKITPRYLSLPHYKQEIPYVDLYKTHPAEYDAWLSMQSPVDRCSIAFQVLDIEMGDVLSLWQLIERYNYDRKPLKAVEVALTANSKDKSIDNYWNALAHSYFILTSYTEAEKCCEKAFAINLDNRRTKRVYADILHETGKQEQAHEIYQEIIKQQFDKESTENISLETLLGFRGDVINSPIYAVAWLNNDENIADEHWQWANLEFHYSPHFRCEYAYKRLRDKKYVEGVSALILVSREMPWYKEAVINSLDLIDKMDLMTYLSKDKIRLEQIIEANKWHKND